MYIENTTYSLASLKDIASDLVQRKAENGISFFFFFQTIFRLYDYLINKPPFGIKNLLFNATFRINPIILCLAKKIMRKVFVKIEIKRKL